MHLVDAFLLCVCRRNTCCYHLCRYVSMSSVPSSHASMRITILMPCNLCMCSSLRPVGQHIIWFLFSFQLKGIMHLKGFVPRRKLSRRSALYSVYVFLFEVRGVAYHFISLQSSAGGTKCIKNEFVRRRQPSHRSDQYNQG